MHLGYVTTSARGATDRLLSELAGRLQARGLRLAGVVQSNQDCPQGQACDMDLRLLPDGPLIRISQSLGAGSSGCRLDTSALEEAVGLTGPALERGPELLMINKFGKHEAEGRGFRPLIGEALLRGIPVLLGVNAGNLAAFLAFAGEAAEAVAPDLDSLEAWVARAGAEAGKTA
ncbi:MAG: DUF2478 domain-containing protein [Pseudodonghicola sp.]